MVKTNQNLAILDQTQPNKLEKVNCIALKNYIKIILTIFIIQYVIFILIPLKINIDLIFDKSGQL